MRLHPGSPVNKLWSRFGNHEAYHVSDLHYLICAENVQFEETICQEQDGIVFNEICSAHFGGNTNLYKR